MAGCLPVGAFLRWEEGGAMTTYIHPDSVHVCEPEQLEDGTGRWIVRVYIDGRLSRDHTDTYASELDAVAAFEHYSEGLR